MTVGTALTHKKKLQRLRKKLEARGIPAGEVERLVAIRRADLAEARRIVQERGDAPRSEVDDSGFRPSLPDPLLRGAGRVTGDTARAVKRPSKALTKHEIEGGS